MSDTPRTDAALDELAEDQRGQVCYNGPTFINFTRQLERQNAELRECLKAVLLFHSASPWTTTKQNDWWNLTQTVEATTRNLCDTIRCRLGMLPSCFGDFTGRKPSDLPPDLRLNDEQRVALRALQAKEDKP